MFPSSGNRADFLAAYRKAHPKETSFKSSKLPQRLDPKDECIREGCSCAVCPHMMEECIGYSIQPWTKCKCPKAPDSDLCVCCLAVPQVDKFPSLSVIAQQHMCGSGLRGSWRSSCSLAGACCAAC